MQASVHREFAMLLKELCCRLCQRRLLACALPSMCQQLLLRPQQHGRETTCDPFPYLTVERFVALSYFYSA